METFLKELYRKYDYSEYDYVVRESKTTNSVYLVITTKVLDKTLRTTFRISDHPSNKKGSSGRMKSKRVGKKTKFSSIEKGIVNTFNNIKKTRLNILLNNISEIDLDKDYELI